MLAAAGRTVVLFEKAAHPRFHIGESMLPCSLPIFERLGVLDEVDQIGVLKPGADFTCAEVEGAAELVQTFRFERALGETPAYAYEVTRSELDKILFDNCVRKGVDARERHTVTKVESLHGGDQHRITYTSDKNQIQSIVARFVVDASGRDGLLARSNGWRKKSRRHASAALFGHFAQVPRRDGDNQGNISIYWFEQGWIWMIPLGSDVMSVGAVCWPSYLKRRDCDPEAFLRATVAGVGGARERFQNAVATTSVQITGNYSYRSSVLGGTGYLLVGDAYAFVDPVFSSGVYLAMNSAEQAVPLIEAWLAGEQDNYQKLNRTYGRAIDRKIASFSWFIYRFTTPAMRDLFRNPRNDWQVEQAVISMLAGDGDGSSEIRWRLMIFKLIYYGYRMQRLGESFRAWRRRRASRRIKFDDETVLTDS
jgi:flavin-dependent dehydrogenase